MSVSSANGTVVIQYRDSFSKAVAKNVIVVVIGISINYINVGLIHTFCKHQFQEMNTSSANVTVVLQYRDPISKAVAKNLIVVVIGISINYINAGLIHTFCKHQ
ncbi:Bifunctional protein FolD, partial [Dissostichus eleginoides]